MWLLRLRLIEGVRHRCGLIGCCSPLPHPPHTQLDLTWCCAPPSSSCCCCRKAIQSESHHVDTWSPARHCAACMLPLLLHVCVPRAQRVCVVVCFFFIPDGAGASCLSVVVVTSAQHHGSIVPAPLPPCALFLLGRDFASGVHGPTDPGLFPPRPLRTPPAACAIPFAALLLSAGRYVCCGEAFWNACSCLRGGPAGDQRPPDCAAMD